MKEKWFEYVVENKRLWGNAGITLKRLEKVKDAVLSDKDIMFDLLERHSGNEKTPEEMKTTDYECYNHCIGNFVCSIIYKMMDEGLIRRSK